MILKHLDLKSNIEGLVTNCYIIEDEVTKETMVIDPPGEVDKIIELLDILGSNLKYIYLTHCHVDHIGAVNALRESKDYTHTAFPIQRFSVSEIRRLRRRNIIQPQKINPTGP